MPRASASLYADLLRNSGALAFCAPAFVGRTPMAMHSLGTVLLISARTGNYALAGTVAAAGFAGSAVVIPAAAALTDNLGQRRILVPQALVFLAGSTRRRGSEPPPCCPWRARSASLPSDELSRCRGRGRLARQKAEVRCGAAGVSGRLRPA
jgi:hypothetical protein